MNSELDHEDESKNLFKINTFAETENFIKETEIDYIINNPKLNISQEQSVLKHRSL